MTNFEKTRNALKKALEKATEKELIDQFSEALTAVDEEEARADTLEKENVKLADSYKKAILMTPIERGKPQKDPADEPTEKVLSLDEYIQIEIEKDKQKGKDNKE